MAQVSNLAELQTALANRDSDIQLTADILVPRQLTLSYAVTIGSLTAQTLYTLRKGAGFSGSLFRVEGGALTLRYIVLDGAQAGHYSENANNRSLVIVVGGALRLESGAVLQSNSSYQEGGGVYLSGDPSYVNTLEISGDARIVGCSSRTSGGGMMAALRNPGDRVIVREQALFSQNSAGDGGGVYVRSYVQGVGGPLTLADAVRITGNEAERTGGGLYCSSFRSGGDAPVSLTLGGGVSIDENRATHGGGVYYYGPNDGDRVELTGSAAVARNTASENGGGLCLLFPRSRGRLDCTGGSISENSGGTGGGLYLLTSAGGSFLFSGCTVASNRATNGASGAGGGLWLQNNASAAQAEVTLRNLTLFGNTATAQGGGGVLNGGAGPVSLQASNSRIAGNTAGTNGGGLLTGSAGGARINMDDCRIEQNTAGGYGGGWYYANTSAVQSAIDLTHVAVTGNTAGQEGGGLRFTSGDGTLATTLRDTSVSDNTAQNNSGGGVWIGGADHTLLLAGGALVTRNVTEEGNGGGIYFNSANGTLTLADNSAVTYNRADVRASSSGNHGGGVCVMPGRLLVQDSAEIAYNHALSYGGALSAAEGSVLTMTGGSIHDNASGGRGGGLWNHGGSRFTMTGGDLYRNNAAIGGGLYNDTGSSVFLLGDSRVGGGGPNTADRYAPGVYNRGFLYTEGSRDLQNGLYIDHRQAVARLQNALAPGAVIQLDSTDYVAPNAAGTPIVVGEATEGYPLLQQSDADAFRKPVQGFNGWEIRLSDDHTQTLLAPVVYRIVYENLRGAFHPNPDAYTVLTPDIELAAPDPLPGYTFLGWYDAPEGGSPVTRIPQGSTGDRTLYARWEPQSLTVTYHGNDAGGPPARGIPDPMQVQYGQTAVLSSVFPVRDGYRLLGWNTEPDGGGTTYQPGQTLGPVTTDVALYAQWETAPPVVHTVTYHGNACCPPVRCVPAPATVREGQSVRLSCAVPARGSYCFAGWNTLPDGSGTTYLPGQSVGPIFADLELYALWRPRRPCSCCCCRCRYRRRCPYRVRGA